MCIFDDIHHLCWGSLLLKKLKGILVHFILSLNLDILDGGNLVGLMNASLCCLNDAIKRLCNRCA